MRSSKPSYVVQEVTGFDPATDKYIPTTFDLHQRLDPEVLFQVPFPDIRRVKSPLYEPPLVVTAELGT